MIRKKSVRRDERGAVLAEFGLLIIPMSVLLLGLLDLGYMMYARSLLQGVINDVARQAAVEDPEFAGTGTIEERIDARIREGVAALSAGGTLTIERLHYDRFSGVGRPEKLMTDEDDDGAYDEDEDCFQDLNENGEFDTRAGASGLGGADDVTVYTVRLTKERILPMPTMLDLLPGDATTAANYNLTASTAVRNQPYDNQAVPPTVCPA